MQLLFVTSFRFDRVIILLMQSIGGSKTLFSPYIFSSLTTTKPNSTIAQRVVLFDFLLKQIDHSKPHFSLNSVYSDYQAIEKTVK